MGTTAEGATAAGDPGVRGLCHGAGREGPKGTPPPAAAKCLAPWLCCAYDMLSTCVQRRGGEKGAPPPPNTTTPPRANAGREGAKSAPPPWTTRQGGEAEEGGCGTSHTTVPVEGARRASPGGGTTGDAGVG